MQWHPACHLFQYSFLWFKQGSGIGPVLYTVYSSDFKAAGKDSILVKYADDTTIIYPGQTAVYFADEFKNIQEWTK